MGLFEDKMVYLSRKRQETEDFLNSSNVVTRKIKDFVQEVNEANDLIKELNAIRNLFLKAAKATKILIQGEYINTQPLFGVPALDRYTRYSFVDEYGYFFLPSDLLSYFHFPKPKQKTIHGLAFKDLNQAKIVKCSHCGNNQESFLFVMEYVKDKITDSCVCVQSLGTEYSYRLFSSVLCFDCFSISDYKYEKNQDFSGGFAFDKVRRITDFLTRNNYIEI